MGLAYINVSVLRRLNAELDLSIDKRLRLFINTMLFKMVIPLRI